MTDRVEPVSNVLFLSQFGGDWDILASVIDVFLADYPTQLAAIKQSIADRDSPALSASAHRIRGSVSVFGAEAAAYEALKLEQAGVACTQTGVDDAFDRLALEVERLGLTLKHLRTQGTVA